MPRYLAQVFAFALAFALLALPLEVWLQHRVADPFAWKYRALVTGAEGANALVLGSSYGLHDFAPADLDGAGLRWYNFAFSGAGPGFWAKVYDLYRGHAPAPKVVLLDVDWFCFGPMLERQIEHDSAYLPVADFAKVAARHDVSRRLMLANSLALLRQRTWLQGWLVGLPGEPKSVYAPEKYDRGYLPLVSVQQAAKPGPTVRLVLEASVRDLEGLIARLEAEGVCIVLVQPPEYRPLAGDNERYNDRLWAIARRGGLPFLDYNGPLAGPLNFDRASFVDHGHMTERGSHLFGKRLASDLRRLSLDCQPH